VIVQDASSVDQDIDGLQLGEDGLQQLGGLGDKEYKYLNNKMFILLKIEFIGGLISSPS